MRRIAAIVLVLGVCVGAAVLSGASSDQSKGRTYKVVFDNAFGLVEGGDFRVGGVTAGKTEEFTVQKRKGKSPKAVVTAKIDKPGFDDFRQDASCTILPQSLIGEYFVDCQPGSSKKKLKTDGTGTIPVENTTSTVAPDLVGNIMRRPYRERLRLIINELGTGLAGRPKDLQEVLRRAHPGLRETNRVLKILGDQSDVIERFVADSDRVIEELEANKRDVARWVVEAGDAAEISATRRADIARSFRRLPTFLGELRPTMRRLGELADEQNPLLRDLQTAAPHLNTFFRRLGPFARASRPAIRSLGASSRRGTAAFREGADEIRELKALAPEAQPTFKPLRQFLEAMDERRRAIDVDLRAKPGSPPPPDKTAIEGEGGFTGMEAIWNYFFWQTLSLNGYDQFGHVLRVAVTEPGECGSLHSDVDPDSETFHNCSQWLGPDLPGITTDDPTDPSNPRAARLRAQAGKPARRVGERRAPGEPEAGPLPGQRDISKPQYALPPALQQLLDRLAPGTGQQIPRPDLPNLTPRLGGEAGQGQAQDNQLLDYLMRP